MKIQVPIVPPEAFQPDRPMNGRQYSQIYQLSIVFGLPPPIENPKVSERQAGDMIREFIEFLLQNANNHSD